MHSRKCRRFSAIRDSAMSWAFYFRSVEDSEKPACLGGSVGVGPTPAHQPRRSDASHDATTLDRRRLHAMVRRLICSMTIRLVQTDRGAHGKSNERPGKRWFRAAILSASSKADGPTYDRPENRSDRQDERTTGVSWRPSCLTRTFGSLRAYRP